MIDTFSSLCKLLIWHLFAICGIYKNNVEHGRCNFSITKGVRPWPWPRYPQCNVLFSLLVWESRCLRLVEDDFSRVLWLQPSHGKIGLCGVWWSQLLMKQNIEISVPTTHIPRGRLKDVYCIQHNIRLHLFFVNKLRRIRNVFSPPSQVLVVPTPCNQ